jgi:regulator of sigma E protease
VAKIKGVGVEKFSLGFGPKIIGIKKGETEYLLSLLPLGGYVKMTGESPGEDVSPAEMNKSFAKKPVSTRAAIVAAGPIMNLILSVLLFPLIFMIGVQVPAYLDRKVEVGYVTSGAVAEKAGLKKGDVITSVDSKQVSTWERFLEVADSDKPLKLGVTRASKQLEITLAPVFSKDTGEDATGMYPVMPAVIGDISEGYPAKEAGLKDGDIILSVDGVPVTHWAELEGIIHKNGAKKVFLISRGDKTFAVEITPKHNKEANVYLIGVARKVENVMRRYGVIEAIPKGFVAGVDMAGRLFMVIKGLVAGKYSLKTLGGPIMIAQYAGKAAKSGLVDVLTLVAFLSLQLGIINLFPIPVLDGGHILFFGIELIKGSPLSERFMGVAQQIGIVLLILLMLLVTYNDIFRIIGKL